MLYILFVVGIWKSFELNNVRCSCNTNVHNTDRSHVSIGILWTNVVAVLSEKEMGPSVIAQMSTVQNMMRQQGFVQKETSE